MVDGVSRLFEVLEVEEKKGGFFAGLPRYLSCPNLPKLVLIASSWGAYVGCRKCHTCLSAIYKSPTCAERTQGVS